MARDLKIAGAFEVGDELWSKVKPLIPRHERLTGKIYRRATGAGRKSVDPRTLFSAMVWILRNRLPWKELRAGLPSATTVHRHFKLWQERGFFVTMREAGLDESPELKGLPWELVTGGRHAPLLKFKDVPFPPSPLSSEIRESTISDPSINTSVLQLHSATEISTFWEALQALIRSLIPNNAVVAYLDFFDHPKSWMAAKILATENAIMPTEWFEKRWKVDITPQFIKAHPGIKFFRFSDIIADRRVFQNTDYFRQFFKPFGWHHTCCLYFWRGTGLSSAIALRRTKDQGDYRPDEVELLKKLHTHIEIALKRLLPLHEDQTKVHWLRDFAQHLPVPLLLLDWNLNPFCVNREASVRCAVWNFGPRKARAYNPRAVFGIPSSLARACAELKTRWLEDAMMPVVANRPKLSSCLSHPHLPGYRATITLQTSGKNFIAKPGFMIYFENQEAADHRVIDFGDDSKLWWLTTAERDLVRLAADDCSNKDIAARLNKSVNTVKHQLSSIYSKMGMSGRGRWLAHSLRKSECQ